MAIIKSGATPDELAVDPVSKALRITEYDSTGRAIPMEGKATYSVAGTFTPAAAATDVVVISGSATTTVRVRSMFLTTNNTAANSQRIDLIKRSAADSAGTFVQGTAVSHDSIDPPATAVAGHYTGNPTLGAAVGTVNIMKVASPVLVTNSFGTIAEDAGVELIPSIDGLLQEITLRGTSQQLCINLGGVALVAGQVHAYRIAWTEE